MTLAVFGLLLFAYLLGSIPFSALITKWRTGEDLYTVGEGNVGSRNVWHVVGPRWGVLAALLDGLKGWICYLVSTDIVHASVSSTLLAGFAVVLGHQFPLYAGGRGGKGLATMGGFLLGFAPLPTLSGLAALGVMFWFTRDSNLSIIFGPVAIVISCLLLQQPTALIAAAGFGVQAGLKKLLDLPHERRVWLHHPWQGTTARPAMSSEATDDAVDIARAGEEK